MVKNLRKTVILRFPPWFQDRIREKDIQFIIASIMIIIRTKANI
jgi:hypothetical protein